MNRNTKQIGLHDIYLFGSGIFQLGSIITAPQIRPYVRGKNILLRYLGKITLSVVKLNCFYIENDAGLCSELLYLI